MGHTDVSLSRVILVSVPLMPLLMPSTVLSGKYNNKSSNIFGCETIQTEKVVWGRDMFLPPCGKPYQLPSIVWYNGKCSCCLLLISPLTPNANHNLLYFPSCISQKKREKAIPFKKGHLVKSEFLRNGQLTA